MDINNLLLAYLVLFFILLLVYLFNNTKSTEYHPITTAKLKIKNLETVNTYYNDLQKHDNDSQNVHNLHVINALRKKYTRLVELNIDFESLILPTINKLLSFGLSINEIDAVRMQEIINQIEKCAKMYDINKQYRISRVLTEINKGKLISSLSQPDDSISESYILTLIWNRIHHTDNHDNVNIMEIALLDQLLDCVTDSSIDIHFVCITGRVARMISSLSLLDKDPILFEPEKDTKEIANLAYSKAHNILQNELKNNNMESVYISDPSKLTIDDQNNLNKFEESVRNQIKEVLHAEYKNILSAEDLSIIIIKAQSGV